MSIDAPEGSEVLNDLRRAAERLGEVRTLAVVGPTAVGKTGFALRLAEGLAAHGVDAEIVNADALQVYRGLDLGTVKPSVEERARVRHHMVDVVEPEERFSAGEFARRARTVLDDLHAHGARGLVVGGSGFYHKALFEGLSPLPTPDAEVRESLAARAREEGSEALHEELRAVDPEAAERLSPGDTQRVARALEVWLSTGRTLTSWIAAQPAPARPLSALHVGLTVPRSILYDAIAARVSAMLERGWIEEVEHLLQRGVDPECPAFQAIGYRQLVRHLHGEWSLDEAVADTVRATRQFAKRQWTWFRRQRQVVWLDARDAAQRASDVLELLMTTL